MVRTILTALAAVLVTSHAALAGGTNRVYLVPALKECPGPATCPREFESAYTFEAIVLHTPASKYGRAGKPQLAVEFVGVRDPGGAPFTGTLKVKVSSGRVSIPGFGTLPDGSPLVQVAPIDGAIKNGKGKVRYTAPQAPGGLITNGGGVEILDPDGNLLAVTGTQTKP